MIQYDGKEFDRKTMGSCEFRVLTPEGESFKTIIGKHKTNIVLFQDETDLKYELPEDIKLSVAVVTESKKEYKSFKLKELYDYSMQGNKSFFVLDMHENDIKIFNFNKKYRKIIYWPLDNIQFLEGNLKVSY